MDRLKAVLNSGSLNEIIGLLVGVSTLMIFLLVILLGTLLMRGKDE
jgi:hypothetical protein